MYDYVSSIKILLKIDDNNMSHDIEKPGIASTVSPVLVRALRQVLRPLVMLMLTKGITYPYLIDLLKEIFVEVGDKTFNVNTQTATNSYLSLLTGVHRKDVKRLLASIDPQGHTIPENVTLGARLVSLWVSDARYLDDNNQPKPLPRYVKEGGECSFEGLVKHLSSDIRSRAILEEWLRLGVVNIDIQQRVCLNVSAFVPSKAFDEKAAYLGHNLADHAVAAVANLLSDEKAFLERCVHYNALSADSVKALATHAESLGMQAMLDINKKAISLEAKDAKIDEPHHRITYGIYFYHEPVEHVTDTPIKNSPKKSAT